MSLIVTLIVILIVMALLIWVVQYIPMIPQPIKMLLIALIVLGGVYYIVTHAGLA